MKLESLSVEELVKLKSDLQNQVKLYDVMQSSIKVTLNSAYGTMGCEYFRYYDIRLAEAITMTAQYIIKLLQKNVNDFLNKEFQTKDEDYIIAMDTDSLYLNLGKLKSVSGNRTDDLNEFAKTKIQSVINSTFEHIKKSSNCVTSKLEMKRESISRKALWSAGKKYALLVDDKEEVRYREPKLNVTGLSIVSLSTPEFIRTNLKNALYIIMTGTNDELLEHTEGVRNDFDKLDLEKITFSKKVNLLEKYPVIIDNVDNLIQFERITYTNKSQVYVKSAHNYNMLIDKLKLGTKYEKIKNNDNIKYLYLKSNIYNYDSIGYLYDFPEEFNLDNSIDREEHFKALYLKPLQGLAEKNNFDVVRERILLF